MIRPDGLKKAGPLLWSAGNGCDVWEMFCACVAGDLDAVERLVAKDPSLVRGHAEIVELLTDTAQPRRDLEVRS